MDPKILNTIFSVMIIICLILIVVFSVNFAKDFIRRDGKPLNRGAKIASVVVPVVVGFFLIPALAVRTVGKYTYTMN